MPLVSTLPAMKTELSTTEKTIRLVLSFLIGVLIWGAAIDAETFFIIETPELFFEHDETYALLGNYSHSINVRLSGTGLEILSHQVNSPLQTMEKTISTRDILSLPAILNIELKPSDISQHGAVTVLQVTPAQIPVIVDTIISRSLPVSVRFSDEIPARYRFVSVIPDCITVTGPSSIVLLMDSVKSEIFELNSGDVTASLAFSSDMVAYSDELVQIHFVEPIVPDSDLH